MIKLTSSKLYEHKNFEITDLQLQENVKKSIMFHYHPEI